MKGITTLINHQVQFDELLKIIPKESNEYELIIKLNQERNTLIETFSNAFRLIADLQHDACMVRRNLVLGMTHNDAMKEIFKSSEIGEWLFGEGILEKIKVAKTTEAVLKNPEKRGQSNGKFQNSKNSRGPPRAGKDYRLPSYHQSHRKTSFKHKASHNNNSNSKSAHPKNNTNHYRSKRN